MSEQIRPRTATPKQPGLPLRLAVVMTGSLVIWLGMSYLSEHVYGGLPQLARHALNAAVVAGLAVPLVVAARHLLDRRSWSGLRLTGIRAGWWPFTVGALSWLVPGLAGIALCVALGWAHIDVRATPLELLRALLLLTVLVFVFEAFPEELVFRGYLQRNLDAAMPPWAAVAVQALLFSLFGTVLWVVSAGWGALAERAPLFLGMGVVLGCLRVITANVWGCVGYHLAFQVVAQLLLTGHYAEVAIGGADVLVPVVFGSAFVLGPTIASLLARSPQNWRNRAPDPV
ncbi:CPBP family intramembrane metalloprotease [Thermobifida alba]|jgi:membrane protease YdiL (CAAX protease family)|uniref:CPBP family intramembrane metalloprotease n=1 Tax=Thermobifida alba TaxID=53522 RepID=A0ABY4L856_THEAE|nr:type II CAAX endopeptidase family protein [Thermobifida alba]UPT22277.1 CPBP family intramembrane metalloprotease [Thermobifida alba]